MVMRLKQSRVREMGLVFYLDSVRTTAQVR